MEYAALLGFIGVAAIFVYAYRAVTDRLANQHAAWDHRKAIAKLAARIEMDPTAPAEARAFVAKIADHVFDEALFRRFVTQPNRLKSPNREALRVRFTARYGAYHGEIVYTAVREFAYVILLSDRKWGRRVRQLKGRAVAAKEIKSVRTDRISAVNEWLLSVAGHTESCDNLLVA